MKRQLLLTMAILMITSIKAQYLSVLSDTNQYWKVYKVQTSLGVQIYSDSVYLGKSIQFNGFTYTEKFSRVSNGFNPPIPTGYLREDTSNGRLWYLTDTFSFGTEHLVYDFSLSIGDTFDVPDNVNSFTKFVVENRDTISGNQRIQLRGINDSIDIKYPFLAKDLYKFDTLIFLEGIGSSLGIDNRLYWDNIAGEESRLLLCHFKNNIQTYQHDLSDSLPFLGQCDTIVPPGIISAVNEELISEEVKVFPTISDGVLNIKTSIPILAIEVYNLQGQKVQSINPQKRSWQLPKESGMYLVRVTTEEGEIVSKKLIKR
jgi:hypothetical protein